MNYAEALAYLDSFVNFERNVPTRTTRTQITLDRVKELAARLGDPQNRFPSLHIAGTKGKGSTCAFAESILSSAGLKVGLYTSPHLQDVRERIRIGAQMIPQSDFARLLEQAKPSIEQMRKPPKGERRPTYFEIITHLAFAWFAEQNVDVAVVEVGLGGRLDATNIVTPLACGITNISLDHQAILGDTLDLIAREKAGIIKPNVPVVVGPQSSEALAAIEETANSVGAPCELAGREWEFGGRFCENGKRRDYPGAYAILPGGVRREAELGLRGAFQVDNWALAVRLADLFFALRGQRVPDAAVREGSRNVSWPGRLEEIAPRIFLDGAHNDHSLDAVLKELREINAAAPITVVFACAKDKDSQAMLRVLAESKIASVIFTQSESTRARDPKELAAEWKALSGQDALYIHECAKALEAAKKLAQGSGMVLATGSLYLVGAIKDAMSKI
jgi:dihydrofolate synthase/folylpolyglutamate synthase